MILKHKEEISIQPEQKEEKKISKNVDYIRTLWDISICTNIWIIRVPQVDEKEQEIENLSEKIMKENIPNLMKKTDIQVQEAQSSKQVEPQKGHTKTS